MSLIRWVALRGVDAEYVDADEEEGVQFELLLDDESPSDEVDGETISSESTTSQRAKVMGEVNGAFITILE